MRSVEGLPSGGGTRSQSALPKQMRPAEAGRLDNIVLGEADPPCQKRANADVKSVEGFRRWSIKILGERVSRISIHAIH
jgi:hypothetical protein